MTRLNAVCIVAAGALAMPVVLYAFGTPEGMRKPTPTSSLTYVEPPPPATAASPFLDSPGAPTPVLHWWRGYMARLQQMPKRTRHVQVTPDLENAVLFWPEPDTLPPGSTRCGRLPFLWTTCWPTSRDPLPAPSPSDAPSS